jgi:mannan endo-1,4-beta-mannosidase
MKKDYYNKIRLRRLFVLLPLVLLFAFYSTGLSVTAASISVSINTSRERKPISPYIYGINRNDGIPPVKAYAVKQTGVYQSTYNWEIDAANSGAASGNINFPLSSSGNEIYSAPAEPAASPSSFMYGAAVSGTEGRFLTLPLSGYAAADTDGVVFEYDSGRFKHILNRKDGEYFLSPDTEDEFVYTDEYIAFMINRFGGRTDETDMITGLPIPGINGYFLGSEPERYDSQFPMLGLPRMTAESLASICESAALTVKMIDPAADVFAPGVRNLESFINLSNTSDWETHSDEHSWFIDYFLTSMREAGEAQGIRLLDCLDLQFYTEAVSASGVSVLDSSSKSANAARMEAPRLFWDSEYSEQSRAAVTYKAYTPLIPIIQASIRMNYPGTKLSFSEYSFGGGDNVSGGIAVAETLGIFGESGVYMAGLVPSEDPAYELAGLKLFTDFDGAGSSFAPVSVAADTVSDTLVYASTDEGSDARLTVVALNPTENVISNRFIMAAQTRYKDVRIYSFNAESPEISSAEGGESGSSADGGESGNTADDGTGESDSDNPDGDTIVEIPEIRSNVFDFDLEPMTAYIFEFTGVWNGIAPVSPDNGDLPDVTAVTDEYGATITDTGESALTETESPVINTVSAPATTVSAPASEKSDSDDGSVPLPLKIIGTVLIVTVLFGMALVIGRTLKN